MTEAAACAQSCAIEPTGSESSEAVDAPPVPPPLALLLVPPEPPPTRVRVFSQACFSEPDSSAQASPAVWIIELAGIAQPPELVDCLLQILAAGDDLLAAGRHRAVGGRERDPLPVATGPAQGDGDRRPVLDDRVRRPLTGQAGEGDGPHRDGRVVTAALDQRHADRGASLYEGLSGGRYAVR